MADDDKNSRLDDILTQFDMDWSAGEDARTEARNDLFFSRVSQWDDWLSQYTTLQYRGQFDVVRPVVRKLVAEMRKNPIDVRYRPKDGADPGAADVLMGMYRTDMRHNTARTSVNIAVREQIEAGVGAWRLVTEHEDNDPTSNNQIIRRVPIHGACSHVVWDANSKQLDKSDAQHVTVINAMSQSGWKAFAKKHGLDAGELPTFTSPNDWLFSWQTSDNVFIAEYYEVEEKKETVFIYQDPLTGEPVSYYQRDIKDVIDELADKGMEKIAERKVTRRRVYKTILSNTAILKNRERIAGEHLPIVPVYGEWGFVDDVEVYEGVVRLTKDGQRLRNMIMSFNADIVGRTPKKKPIFWPEQIEGYEYMYSGDDDFPYYLMNRTDEHNGQLPAQPIAYVDNPEVPQANAYMLEAATAAVKEVADTGVDGQAVNGNQVAFETVNQLNQRADLETYVFMDNLATAMRRDGEIYQAMVNDIYDVPRTVLTTAEDGSENEVQTLSQAVDYQSGRVVVLNDIRGRYECYTDAGPSFQSMKDQNRAEIQELLKTVPAEHQVWNVLLLQYLALLDGKGIEITRDYATKQLVVQQLKKPETPDEERWLQEAQQAQQNQQDPNMLIAQAQIIAAQAETEKARNETAQTEIKAFTAQQEAQRSQADTIYKLAQARNIDSKAVIEALKLMHEVATRQQQSIPTGSGVTLPPSGESPQSM
ncbi:portal protein [Erwinia psidii]|uniref:portal protein n=1 Tax=Erwinia psidii TaxID=69224 RepID=UPI002B490EDC|nr:portal protein [Erwinia psidii]MCX8965129.1 portal protein [Erwinia psidii]